MDENEFIPVGLPLLSDAVLMKTVMDYRYAQSMLISLDTPLSRKTLMRIEDALHTIEHELKERGLTAVDAGKP